MLRIALILLALAVSGCETVASAPALKETASMPTPTTLAACPDSPNCVNSLASDKVHRIEPLPLRGTPQASMQKLRDVVGGMPRTEFKVDTPTYLKVEFTSFLFRFVDDVEFLYDPSQQVIQMRSASRIGYSDMGANRKRMESVREAYIK